MAGRSNRYRKLERYMTWAITGDAVFFVLYLVFAGVGTQWAKVLFAVLSILLSVLLLAYLYLVRELCRRRSLWMSTAAAAVLICTIFSLILSYPRPKYRLEPDSTIPQSTVADTTEPNPAPDSILPEQTWEQPQP